MKYRVHCYYQQWFEQHEVTSQTKALALAKLKRADGWAQVVILWPGSEQPYVFAAWL